MGAPGRIVEMGRDHAHLASVDVRGVVRQINIGLIEEQDPQPGDWVDVHLGMALSIMEEKEAKEALEFLDSFGPGATERLGDG